MALLHQPTSGGETLLPGSVTSFWCSCQRGPALLASLCNQLIFAKISHFGRLCSVLIQETYNWCGGGGVDDWAVKCHWLFRHVYVPLQSFTSFLPSGSNVANYELTVDILHTNKLYMFFLSIYKLCFAFLFLKGKLLSGVKGWKPSV